MKYNLIIFGMLVLLLFLIGCSNESVKDEICTEGKTYFNGTDSCIEETKVNICTSEQKQADVCTMQYDPVCGNDGKTYSNSCVACSEGADSWIEGECP